MSLVLEVVASVLRTHKCSDCLKCLRLDTAMGAQCTVHGIKKLSSTGAGTDTDTGTDTGAIDNT